MPNKPIFNSSNSDISKNAYMNWMTSTYDQINNFCILADGYYEAAHLLSERILKDNSDNIADALIYPMVFDLNQSMELYLKALQWMLNILNENEKKFENGHNLIGLYGTMNKLLTDFEQNNPQARGDKQEYNKMMAGVQDYIDELKVVISQSDWKTMDFPRYPLMSDKETAHFYVADKNNVTIDVEYFQKRIEDIHDALQNLTYHFGSLVENKR